MTAAIGAKQRRSVSMPRSNGLLPLTRHTAPAAMAVHTTWSKGASMPRSAVTLNISVSPATSRKFMA